MKQYYIYLTTNLINGKKYIGQHYGELTDNYLGSGIILTKAIKEYGKENFSKDILCICTKDTIDEKEKEFIALYNAVDDDNFYNLTEGGQQGDGWKSAYRYFQNHPEEAKKIYAENNKRLHEWWKEHPEEKKKNIELLHASSKKWRENNPERVKEIMQKVNEAKIKWQQEHQEEHQLQVEKWRQKGSEANSQKVLCVNTGEIFSSQSEAGRKYEVPQANISKCLKGERKSAGKHPQTGEKLFWKKL